MDILLSAASACTPGCAGLIASSVSSLPVLSAVGIASAVGMALWGAANTKPQSELESDDLLQDPPQSVTSFL